MRCVFFTRFRLHFAGILILTLCWILPTLLADEPPAEKTGRKPPTIAPPTERELADERIQFMKKALARYTIRVGEQKEPATVNDPCLRWSNPINGAPDGIVAVYAHRRGRPTAVGQFFLNFQKRWVNEFTIIPQSDVTIMRSDRVIWKPSEYVCKFTDLPHSPTPADKAALRLTQMRAVAEDFSAFNYLRGTKQDLRLLRQPVYRYSEQEKIVDGALFVFVIGTDPECCLLVEAYQVGMDSRYRYAVAPMSIRRLEVDYKKRRVWDIEARSPAGAKSRSYFAGNYSPEPGEVLPE